MEPTLRELLSRVRYEPRFEAVEGLEPFRRLLEKASLETFVCLVNTSPASRGKSAAELRS